jgi:hypothetical protein
MLNGYWLAYSSGVQGRGATPFAMRYFAAIFVVLAVALSGFAATAQPFPRPNGGQQMQPLNNILGAIRSQYPGQLSDVQGPVNGRYLIKWLTPQGEVLLLDVDARTGQVLGVRGGGNFRRQNFAPESTYIPERDRWRNDRLERRRQRMGPSAIFPSPGNRGDARRDQRANRWDR